jgi:hypothetical protein
MIPLYALLVFEDALDCAYLDTVEGEPVILLHDFGADRDTRRRQSIVSFVNSMGWRRRCYGRN